MYWLSSNCLLALYIPKHLLTDQCDWLTNVWLSHTFPSIYWLISVWLPCIFQSIRILIDCLTAVVRASPRSHVGKPSSAYGWSDDFSPVFSNLWWTIGWIYSWKGRKTQIKKKKLIDQCLNALYIFKYLLSDHHLIALYIPKYLLTVQSLIALYTSKYLLTN